MSSRTVCAVLLDAVLGPTEATLSPNLNLRVDQVSSAPVLEDDAPLIPHSSGVRCPLLSPPSLGSGSHCAICVTVTEIRHQSDILFCP